MSDILDEIEKEEEFSDLELFLGIFTRPRAVFRFLQRNEYDKYVIVLLCIAGVIGGLDVGNFMNAKFLKILFNIVLYGVLFTIAFNYIFAFVLSWFGKKLKGNQDTKSILRVLAYSLIPSFLGIVFFVFKLYIYFNATNSATTGFPSIGISTYSLRNNFLYIGFAIVSFIWPVALNVIGIAEIQKFSIGKAVLNLCLPIIVLSLISFVIALFTEVFILT